MESVCCSAPIVGEVMDEGEDAVGVCSKCGEWAGVILEEGEE